VQEAGQRRDVKEIRLQRSVPTCAITERRASAGRRSLGTWRGGAVQERRAGPVRSPRRDAAQGAALHEVEPAISTLQTRLTHLAAALQVIHPTWMRRLCSCVRHVSVTGTTSATEPWAPGGAGRGADSAASPPAAADTPQGYSRGLVRDVALGGTAGFGERREWAASRFWMCEECVHEQPSPGRASNPSRLLASPFAGAREAESNDSTQSTR
jgi:hypothetical protein